MPNVEFRGKGRGRYFLDRETAQQRAKEARSFRRRPYYLLTPICLGAGVILAVWAGNDMSNNAAPDVPTNHQPDPGIPGPSENNVPAPNNKRAQITLTPDGQMPTLRYCDGIFVRTDGPAPVKTRNTIVDGNGDPADYRPKTDSIDLNNSQKPPGYWLRDGDNTPYDGPSECHVLDPGQVKMETHKTRKSGEQTFLVMNGSLPEGTIVTAALTNEILNRHILNQGFVG